MTDSNQHLSATETGLGATNRCDCACGQGGSNWTHESAEIDHAVALEREAIAAWVDGENTALYSNADDPEHAEFSLGAAIRRGEHHKGAANG